MPDMTPIDLNAERAALRAGADVIDSIIAEPERYGQAYGLPPLDPDLEGLSHEDRLARFTAEMHRRGLDGRPLGEQAAIGLAAGLLAPEDAIEVREMLLDDAVWAAECDLEGLEVREQVPASAGDLDLPAENVARLAAVMRGERRRS